MLSFVLTALVASAPALASFANVAAVDSSLTSRDDPCSKWCDPWFSITDAEVACQFLGNNASTFQTCAGCSVAHGGSVDEWAADYYNGDYAYFTDCPACYQVNVAGVDFSSVSSLYNSVVSPSASVASATAGKAATSSGVKLALASGSASGSKGAAAATQAYDNTGIKAHSGASKVGPAAFVSVLMVTALASFAL